ncbi:MAG: IPTL-CTERM sorting domain-containing protein [Pseudomonadota bacterium]
MKKIHNLLVMAISCFLLLGTIYTGSAVAATITVNTTDDELNADGDCSLREAVDSANRNLGIDACTQGEAALDTIIIPAGTYQLVGVTGDDANVFGDLDILNDVLAPTAGPLGINGGPLLINGAAASTTIIRGTGGGANDHVIQVFSADSSVFIQNVTIENGSGGLGAGIVNGSGTRIGGNLTLQDCVIQNNITNVDGGGLYTNAGNVVITRCTFNNNEATNRSGGGIVSFAGGITVTDSTFSGNTARSGGGILSGGNLSVKNSTFTSNTAESGGGITLSNGNSLIANSTISGNTATNQGGGGIYVAAAGILNTYNTTVSGNTSLAGTGGGIHIVAAGQNHLRNTIVANSIVGLDCFDSSAPNTNINNLIEDNTCSPSLSGDPLLSALASNGGNTQTMALGAGSLAIDAGDAGVCSNAATVNSLDQRGTVRPAACDIGAYELIAAAVAQAIPTLSEWGTILLSVLLGLFAFAKMGNRREIQN